jgi:hypothetical protein
MRALRWTLAILTAGWALANLPALATTVVVKLGWSAVPPGLPASFRLLAEQIPWWGLTIWTLMIVMYLLVTVALLRGRPAFGLFVLAFVTELVRWVPMYWLPAYTQTWTPAEMRFRYVAWGVLVVVGVLVWWAEHRRPLPAQAA